MPEAFLLRFPPHYTPRPDYGERCDLCDVPADSLAAMASRADLVREPSAGHIPGFPIVIAEQPAVAVLASARCPVSGTGDHFVVTYRRTPAEVAA